MLEAPRTTGRSLSTRRTRDVDVYGGAGDATERTQTNIFAVIYRRKWIVLSCIVVALVAGAIYYSRLTPIYASGSTIYVQDNALKMMNDPMAGSMRSQSFAFTQCQVISSSALLTNALQKPGMAQVKMLQGAENPVGLLKMVVTALPDKNSDLINISVESPNPQDAATIANAVVEAYIDYQGVNHRSTSIEVLKVFQKEVEAHEEALRKTQLAILEMKKANPDLTFQTERGGIITTKLGELSDRLTQAQLRALDIKTAAAEAEAVKDDPTALRRLIEQFQVGGEQEAALDPTQMAAYRAGRDRLNDLLDRLGSQHEMVKTAEKQVGRLQQELQQASRDTAVNYAALLKQTLRLAEARVDELQKLLTQSRESAVALNFKQAEFEQLKKDEERSSRSLELLNARVKELNLNEDVGSLTVSVLETAKPAFMPVRPVQSKILGMAMVAGLMGGVGLAMLRDMMDQRLRSADEITALLELPILGVVPHMPLKSKGLENGRTVALQPRSNVAEAYRTIRTAVSFGSGDGTVAKTMLISSPSPGDGKSTSASNLALAFAQSGRRTLLIDADCRRPMQNKVFELAESRPGLSEVLAGQADLHASIRRGVSENLDLLPCGEIPHNPAELLDSQALLDLLGRVSADYDQVVIDSPPVVPVTDARILAASCDVTILVLRADRSTRRLAEHARDALGTVGANLIGLIINDVPRGKNGMGYDYYSYGSYGGYKSAGTARVSLNGDHSADGTIIKPDRSHDA